MCTQLLERYNAEGEAFLQRIVTGDESWVHHYDPECKAQSMELGTNFVYFCYYHLYKLLQLLPLQ